jgi:hypothetical protein
MTDTDPASPAESTASAPPADAGDAPATADTDGTAPDAEPARDEPAPHDEDEVDGDADLAAELDDADPGDHADVGQLPGQDDDDGDPTTYWGVCHGGPQPYPGKRLLSRFPAGILLVDAERELAWVLDYDAAAATFTARPDAPLDHTRRWAAAEGSDFDVCAYDAAFTGDEPDDDTDDDTDDGEGGDAI